MEHPSAEYDGKQEEQDNDGEVSPAPVNKKGNELKSASNQLIGNLVVRWSL